MPIVILGSRGQLARHLQALLPEAVCLGRESLDLHRLDAIQPHLERLEPTVIVNAAAFTAVDAAEEEPEAALRINALAPAQIAAAASRLGATLIQVSTDYVFDGTAQRPYTEGDGVNPINVYGRSKLAGELAVQSLCPRHWILRTSWLFSEHGHNFARAMLHLAGTHETVRVVDDQVGRPTYAGDLAAVVARLATGSIALPWGLYHLAGGRAVSWAGFAARVFERAAACGVLTRVPTLVPITTSEYPTRAPRPANTVLDGTALETRLGVARCDWEAGLETLLNAAAGPGTVSASAVMNQ